MREFRTFFLFIFLTLLTMCFTYHSRLMPLILVSVIILCILSLVISVIAYAGFSANVSIHPPEKVYKNDRFEFDITIKNNSPLPMTPVRIYIHSMGEGESEPVKSMLMANAPPFKKINVKVSNTSSFRGEYKVGIVKAEFFDLLKIFRFSRKVNDFSSVTSYPREIEPPNTEIGNSKSDEGRIISSIDINGDTFSHLREYRDGESLQNIHWKLSAKYDDDNLIVKQMGISVDYSALIFCDFCESAVFSNAEEFLEATDTVIEKAQALAKSIVLNGGRALVFYQREGVSETHLNVGDMNEYTTLKESFAKIPSEPFDGEFIKLFHTYHDEISRGQVIHIITPVVTKELDDEIKDLKAISKGNVVLIKT